MQNALLPVPQDSTETHPLAPSANLTPTDIQRIRQSLDHSVSDNTRKMYASAWRSFQAWALGRGNLYLPASPQVVAAYLAHQAEERSLSVATIRLHKAALAAVHKTHGHDDPTDHEGVSRIMKGIARTHGRSQRQAKPLTAEALAAVRATASTSHPGRRQEAGISRESLLARQSGPGPPVRSPGRLTPTLRGSFAHMGRRGVPEQRDRPFAAAPVQDRPGRRGSRALHRKTSRRRAEGHQAHPGAVGPAGPVFNLSPQQIGRRVTAAAKAAGLGEGFTGHSGRVGMAQDLSNTGTELPALMTAGRWKNSKMPARYTERQAADRAAVARYYQEKG